MSDRLQQLLEEKARRQGLKAAKPKEEKSLGGALKYAAGKTFGTPEDWSRGFGMAGRDIAAGIPSVIDAPRIVTDPLFTAIGKAADLAGADGVRNTMFGMVNAPTVAEQSANLYDKNTDYQYVPKTNLEKAISLVDQGLVGTMSGSAAAKGAKAIQSGAEGALEWLKQPVNSKPDEYKRIAQLITDTGKSPYDVISNAKEMKDNAIPTTLFEQVESPKGLAIQRSLTEEPSLGGSYLQKFNSDRISRLPVERELTKGATNTSPLQTGQQIQEEAANYINSKVQQRLDRAMPLYEDAFSANQDVSSNMIDRVLNTPVGKKALQKAATKMQNDMSLVGVPDKELAEQAKLAGTYEKGGISNGLKLRTLDYVKRSLDDEISSALKAGNNDDARIIGGLKNKLLSELEAADSTGKYAEARGMYSEASPEIKALKDSIVGTLSRTKSPEDAARLIFNEDPEHINRMRDIFMEQNPQAWRNITASHLQSKIRDSGGLVQFINKVDRTEGVSETLKAGLTKEQADTLNKVLTNLRRVRAGLPTNSLTVPKAQAAAYLRGNTGDDGVINQLNASGGLRSRLEDWGLKKVIDTYRTAKGKINEEANYKLAQAITDPDFGKLGKALKDLQPDSVEASKLIDDYMTAKISGVGASIQTEKPSNRDVKPIKAPKAINDNNRLQMLLQEKARRQKKSSAAPVNSYSQALMRTLEHEGGYGNPDYPTIYGVNKKAWPQQFSTIYDLYKKGDEGAALKETSKFYKKNFWDRFKLDEVPKATQQIVFDASVNHGKVFASKLRRAAIEGASPQQLTEMRKQEYQRLAKSPRYKKFLDGWLARAESFNPETKMAAQ